MHAPRWMLACRRKWSVSPGAGQEAAGPDVQVSVIVVDIPTRAVRALAGSASRHRPGGWLDLTAQARSPGSTLKPFIYALAFDDGAATPNTRIQGICPNDLRRISRKTSTVCFAVMCASPRRCSIL